MSADWSKPTTGSDYADTIDELKDRDLDAIKMLASQVPTNLPTNAKQFNPTNKRWENWNGSAWVELISSSTDSYEISVKYLNNKQSTDFAQLAVASTITAAWTFNDIPIKVVNTTALARDILTIQAPVGGTRAAIRFFPETVQGPPIAFNGMGGTVLLCSGEAMDVMETEQANWSMTEYIYLCTDFHLSIITNLQNGWANRKEFKFKNDGTIEFPAGAIVADSLKGWNPAAAQDEMLFHGTTAPTAWTKVTTWNNRALRLVNGTIGTGGTHSFTTVFGASKTTDGHALTESQIPAHHHLTVFDDSENSPPNLTAANYIVRKYNANEQDEYDLKGAPSVANVGRTTDTGGSASHSHTIGNFDLEYVDVILARKNT